MSHSLSKPSEQASIVDELEWLPVKQFAQDDLIQLYSFS